MHPLASRGCSSSGSTAQLQSLMNARLTKRLPNAFVLVAVGTMLWLTTAATRRHAVPGSSRHLAPCCG
jgi:hypothetical protein